MPESADCYDTKLGELLDQHTTSMYHIEYEGFKTNHLSQALYALMQIRAPLEDVEKFVEWIKKEKLEDAALFREKEQKLEPTPTDPGQVMGTRKAYHYLNDHYNNLLKDEYKGSVEKLIAGEFPKLSQGVLGAATHGLIHLGYGYAARRGWFVCEGLAYLHDSYVKPIYSRDLDLVTLGAGSTDILEVVQMVHADTKLITSMMETAESEEFKVHEFTFVRKQNSLFEKYADQLAKYVHMIKFPSGLNGRELTMDKVPDLANWIVDCAIIVYTTAVQQNDFFLLHGVTSGWALSNVLPLLADCQDVLASVKSYLVMLLTVYLIQGSPALDASLVEQNDGMSYNWDDLIRKSIAHEDREKEHMYKLAQVCHGRSKENPDSPLEGLYRLACHRCVSVPFEFGKFE